MNDTGKADEQQPALGTTAYEPSVSLRFMSISDQAIFSYLVTAYHSVAVLTPDALGVLEDVATTR